MQNEKTIYVYADWEGLNGAPLLMGTLNSVHNKGKEIFSFEYEQKWLASGNGQVLDPDLQFYAGRQYGGGEKLNFGLFLDSSPDRWGRVLMKRREAIIARKENRKQATLFESDYLLGVYDEHRIGALRFKLNPDGGFVSGEQELAAPPWTSLRELEKASLQLEQDDFDDDEALKWLNMLMAPGSSLGGARPKASVKDPNGQLWIAKFPSGGDIVDIGGWEAVAMEIAMNAGIKVAPCKAQKFSNKYHTFLSQRFDRNPNGERIHFASAMTMLGYTDGADYTTGVSYLELAEFLIRNGANVNEDLEELWRRIVLNVCMKNTDDHLRNHGFLLTKQGWILSPVYDVNPFPDGTGLTLNISDDDNSLDLDLVRSVITYFRVSNHKAEAIIEQVLNAVCNWRRIAVKIGLPKREQDLMERAFTDQF
ncbi:MULTISPECIES: type II toxin-antitoxin system HipA family toxin [unclassified Chitinophaga]|uniref:type II toxin-antitoxin system HipA family toxin n=1 Tax=unclassified Chitinophaga TaxID=2619133 RepID=UPI0009CF8710|nr:MULTISPECIES: HipA domain-containing protein [unclassified Chitinophaga]OMP76761.1 toxin HipA [[Flexibacter] sp. ATCC 35208]WPV70495.1 HipA domain-containing protein [Chitinophaga sp. LS1]